MTTSTSEEDPRYTMKTSLFWKRYLDRMGLKLGCTVEHLWSNVDDSMGLLVQVLEENARRSRVTSQRKGLKADHRSRNQSLDAGRCLPTSARSDQHDRARH